MRPPAICPISPGAASRGVAVPPGDLPALAAALRCLAFDESLRRRRRVIPLVARPIVRAEF